MKKILFLLFAFTLPLTAQEGLVVQLRTDNQLLPLYLAPFKDQKSGFDREYLKQLREIMRFDFDYNGTTYTLQQEGNWQALGAQFAIEAEIKDRKLSALVYSLQPEIAKKVEDLQLTGQLSVDRKIIHQLSDTIHQTLFGTPGVANTSILYTVRYPEQGKTDQWKSEVWEADYDGANARQLTHHSSYAVTPVFLPGDKGHHPTHFLYVGYSTGQPKIYVASLHDGKSQRFSYMRGNQMMPAISRQRNLVAFISDITTNPDLFLQPFDPKSGPVGKPQQIFHAHLKTQGTPTFSPDGKKIAFVSNKGGNPQVYVMPIPPQGAKLKDIQAKQLTRMNRESTAPAWSPDGSKISYCSKTDGVRQIWVYEFVRGVERQLTHGPQNKENPTWAADSLHLIYNTTDPKSSELYLVNLRQPEAVKISSGSGEKHFPAWES